MPHCELVIDFSVKLRNGSQPYSEIQRQATRHLHRVLNEHARSGEIRVFLYSPIALTQSTRIGQEEVGKRVPRESAQRR